MTQLRTFPIGLLAVALLVRWLVAQFPYSGHSKPPMYGDYEAQRHWMEITTNLPARDWYTNTTDNDLLYWGLDYPPLTAYHMYLLGQTSKHLFNSSWTELHHSRGMESYEHKIFMRATVFLSELLIYFPAVIYYFYKTQPGFYESPPTSNNRHDTTIYCALVLLYPAQILIDHGHFQYNSVFMGLALWAIIFMIKGRQLLSAIAFSLALGYKQMSLYYALPFFWLIASKNLRLRPVWSGLLKIIVIGLAVLSVFAAMFAPYLTDPQAMLQVLNRIFPFNRGLFEDKVANFWFSLSIFYKFRKLYSVEKLIQASTISTLLCSLPAGLHLLVRPNIRNFKYALFNTSMAFFLFSFQVHEKTILVPALPLLLLCREHPMAANWFIIISTFSLQPLLTRDGQLVPYMVLSTIFILVSLETFSRSIAFTPRKIFTLNNLMVITYLTSIATAVLLSLASIFVKPPERYPHIHPTANAVFSCIHFIGFLLFSYISEFRPNPQWRTTPISTSGHKKTN